MLRAFTLDKAKEVVYQIYVSDLYRGDWRYYNAAYDLNGKKLPVTQIRKKVDSCAGGGKCWLLEDVAVEISRGYLEGLLQSGMKIQISGAAGKTLIPLPAGYIQAFLAKVPTHKQLEEVK